MVEPTPEAHSTSLRARLLAIHRRAAEVCVTVVGTTTRQTQQQQQSSDTIKRRREKVEKLNQLKRRRIALAAQVAETRCGRNPLATAATTLFQELQAQQRVEDRSRTTGDTNNADSHELLLLQDAVQQYSVTTKLREMRQQKCLAAAYRLSGISMFPVVTSAADEHCNKDNNHHSNVLALRLDVGTAACYHCFFDVVIDTSTSTTTSVNDTGSSSSSDMLYLRLVQHTLPPAIPLAAILHRHLGGVTAIGRLTDQRWKTTELLQKLRATANQLYHACHCWQVRKETYQYLERLAAKTKIVASPTLSKKKRRSPPSRNSSSSEVPVVQREVEPPLVASPQTYSVDHLECVGCNDAYKTIRFHLHHRLSGIAEAVEVTLQYATDLCRPRAHQPATVTIKIPTAATSAVDVLPRGRNRTATNNTAEVVSDAEDNDEEDIHDEFIENAILSFRRLPIREAMQQVTDAMAEW